MDSDAGRKEIDEGIDSDIHLAEDGGEECERH